tara:strand:+ start:300 stop:794 length:495 start_codon:yes stop_codon:yes gene_type:complete
MSRARDFADLAVGITDSDLPSGSVLQVVQGSTTSNLNTSSTSYVDSGVSASITPSSTSNKILVLVSLHAGTTDSGGNGAETGIQLLRGSTQIAEYQRGIFHYDSSGGTGHVDAVISLCKLDSPSTTSSVTYKPQVKTSSGSFRVNDYSTSVNSTSTITLMEIAG